MKEKIQDRVAIKCMVEHVLFQNEETGYLVCRARPKDKKEKDLITLAGTIGNVSAGMEIIAHGDWTIHPKYGRQFQALYAMPVAPSTAEGIESFLQSDAIKGIGSVYAHKIVEAFGEDTLDVLDHHPEKLLEVPSIGKKRAEAIIESWKKQGDYRDLLIFLSGFGIPTTYGAAISQKFGGDSIRVLRTNPWKLTELRGIGFLKADTIAEKLGFDKGNPKRIQAGLSFTLHEMCMTDGHVFANPETLVTKSTEILGVPVEDVKKELETMIQLGLILNKENKLYLPYMYETEGRVARRMAELLHTKPAKRSRIVDPEVIERKTGTSYGEKQKDAIRSALTGGVTVLTGGPGTGKTYTVNGILNGARMNGLSVKLAAPTGRAAKRMQESTHGHEAMTIHRMLGLGKGSFKSGVEKLKCDMLIVDESSMIDIFLMDTLLEAIEPGTRLVLVGDADQLPSVGPGRVFGDMIESGCIPTIRLTEIHRQAAGSNIIQTAAAVNKGKMPVVTNKPGTDCFFDFKEEPEDVLNDIIKFATVNAPKYFHVNHDDIQILSPMKKGTLGTENLNARMQDILNPAKIKLKSQTKEFRLHDRVMQTRNNYDKGVVNGDIGKIIDVNRISKVMKVAFDGISGYVEYTIQEADKELVLAYACTVHKSQGSEFPVVIMPVSTQHFVMLQRNLIYTAVTRTQKALIMVGSWKAMGIAVRNNAIKKRNTDLPERLRLYCGK